MRFSYYDRLTASQKQTYRASDAVREVRLERPRPYDPLVHALELALRGGSQRAVGNASRALVSALMKALGVEAVTVVVRDQRPSNAAGELHGYYTRPDGGVATIEVWMRTAAHVQVVAFRTFLRTLLHEVCHHLDFVLLKLPDTFHNEGFFRRESSLVRQLSPRSSRPAAVDKEGPRPPVTQPAQLALTLEPAAPPTRSGGNAR